MPVVSVNNLSLPNRLSGVNVKMTPGDIWHVIGANGSGKSSLLTALAGIETTFSGSVHYNEQSVLIACLENRRCFVSQHYPIDFNLSVREILQFFNGNCYLYPELDDTLDIRDLLPRNIRALSGGELQRVQIYRHLASVYRAIQHNDAVVIMDEPTQQLDPAYQVRVLELCQWIAACNNVVIMSHHDVNQTYHYATHALLLKNGANVIDGKCQDIINEQRLSDLYEQPFIDVTAISDSQKYFIARNDPR